MTFPHFIIIGAMKSATSTLHKQLSLQPGIFMSEPKEPNFFSDDDNYAKGSEWYRSLFSNAHENDICGESSTHYTKMPHYPRTVERLKQWKSTYKFIYVMRQPIDRLISHYIHQWSEGNITCNINLAINRYPELVQYSCYARQLRPYFDEFGLDSVLPAFFETIKSNPQSELEKIGGFIGYPGVLTWNSQLGSENVSSNRVRKFLGYNLLVASATATKIRRSLVPRSARYYLKNKLRMADRPVIDRKSQSYLEDVFNEDLEKLSEWFGTNVNCGNFTDCELQATINQKFTEDIQNASQAKST